VYQAADGTTMKCCNRKVWLSSEPLPGSGSHGPVAVNVAVSLALAVSGNQHMKVAKFFKYLNFHIVSSKTYISYCKALLFYGFMKQALE